jgi:hypothetical protein
VKELLKAGASKAIHKPTPEMLADDYHPDWQYYKGTEYRSVGAKQVENGLDTKQTAYQLRNTPGKAMGGEHLVEMGDTWLRGTHANAGKMPKQIADKMRNMEFKTFDEFRKTFWKLVADDPKLSKGFDVDQLKAMKMLGRAPITHESQWVNSKTSIVPESKITPNKVYQLHHINPINNNGGVYDLNNIVIVTPRYHKEILEPNFHKGKGS